jgi:uncharacterized protein YndB with AHSA1/START domain
MKILKRALLFLAVAVALLVAGGFLLPAKVEVSRSVAIQAAPAAIFPYVANLKRWPQWTVWYEREPGMIASYEGPEGAVGSVSRWHGKDGEGQLTLTAVEPDRLIEYELVFDGSMRTQGGIALASAAAGTVVTWRFASDAGMNPLARYFGLVLDRMIGADFDAGLARLKLRVETPPTDGESKGGR